MPAQGSARWAGSASATLGWITVGSRVSTTDWRRRSGRRPSLDVVLARAGDYAIDYGQALTNVLADEPTPSGWSGVVAAIALQTRRLRSEIAFIRLADSTEWLTFSNVARR